MLCIFPNKSLLSLFEFLLLVQISYTSFFYLFIEYQISNCFWCFIGYFFLCRLSKFSYYLLFSLTNCFHFCCSVHRVIRRHFFTFSLAFPFKVVTYIFRRNHQVKCERVEHVIMIQSYEGLNVLTYIGYQ